MASFPEEINKDCRKKRFLVGFKWNTIGFFSGHPYIIWSVLSEKKDQRNCGIRRSSLTFSVFDRFSKYSKNILFLL